MKQTAVEWLVQQLKERGYAGEFPPYLLFEQAKAMEKQQLIGLLEWMNRVTIENPMRLETDNEDIVSQYLETYERKPNL